MGKNASVVEVKGEAVVAGKKFKLL